MQHKRNPTIGMKLEPGLGIALAFDGISSARDFSDAPHSPPL
jgi:hypothetical protein